MSLETNKLAAVNTNGCKPIKARVNGVNRSLQTRGCLVNLPESGPPAFVSVLLRVLEINVTPVRLRPGFPQETAITKR